MKIDEYDAVSTFERIKAEFKEESFLNYLNQHGKKQFLAEVIESDADCLKEVFDDLFYCRDELWGPDSINLFNEKTQEIIKYIKTEYGLSFNGIKGYKFFFVRYLDSCGDEYYDEFNDVYYQEPWDFEDQMQENLEFYLEHDEKIDEDMLKTIEFELLL
ncbi:hypothetical protein [Methanobrevibacter smithii]|jgi:hypothetical protein|uniref:hypothetical protein n=1 Tax=Methanobrevibacter smithii TaxID=2173 RepID=UPI0037DC859D